MSKAGPPPKWNDARDAEVAECIAAGFDDGEIARRLGVTTIAVMKRRNVLGLTRKPTSNGQPRRLLCPPSIKATPFTPEWFEQNDASFRAGWQRAAAGEARSGAAAEPSTGAPSGAREQRPS